MPALGGRRLSRFSSASTSLWRNGDDLGVAERAAVVDRGVAVDVEDDVIVLAGEGRDDPEIGLVAGRKDHRMVHRVEVVERCLAFLVALIGAVEHPAAGGARAELVERLLARRDDVGVERHAHVIIGAEQDRALAVADRDGRDFDPLHDQAERIGQPGRKQRLALLDDRVELGEEIVHLSALSVSTRRPAGRRFRSRPACSS